MSAIEIEALTKYYGTVRGVEDLYLGVEAGEVFGFLGPNGAGKTTTIRMLLDLIRPTSGWVRILGLDPRTQGVALRRRIGYLPGDLSLYERLTGRQVLQFFGALRGGGHEDAVGTLAERLSLDLDRPVGKLSRGNRQKVGLVQAFAHEPDVLLLDEPTSGLDPLMQHVFEELVREATDRGATVFLSSHILSEVQDTADRAGVLRDGRLVAIEDIATLRAKALHQVEVRIAGPVEAGQFAVLPGVRDVEVRDGCLRCRVEGTADRLVKALARHEVVSLTAHELDLEDLFVVLAVSAGSRAIAAEEEQHTLDLLMAQPISRRRVVLEKLGALVVLTVTIGAAAWVVLVVSTAVVGLHAGLGDMTLAMAATVLLGLQSGALALAVGAAVGRRATAIAVASTVAVVGFVLESLAQVTDVLSPVRWLSPYHYVNGNIPMLHGLRAVDVAVLLGLTAAAAVAGLVAFDRRDLST